MTHERTATRRSAAILGLALLALLAGPVAFPAFAQGSDSVLRGFLLTGDLALKVGGKAVPAAQIYKADSVPAFLILTSALPSPVLLSPRKGIVETVSIMKIAKKPDGSADLLADAQLKSLGEFKIVEDSVTFTIDGKPVVLYPKPALLGLRKNTDLKTYNPEYARGASTYGPDKPTIAALKKEARPVKVRVFFGSWCSHCKKHVPMLLRVEDELRGASKIQFEYYGLPQGEAMTQDAEAKKVGIKAVPTGIVYLNGKEIGRIVNWDAPEKGLQTVLNGAAAQKGK